VGYIRDRDFDFEPPEDQTRPTVDRADEKGPFGWRWCRHEIESYLLDPQIVAPASPLNRDEYVDALVDAAGRIRHDQIARWVIGSARRTLPPRYDLTTRPAGFERDFHLPVDMNAAPIFQWAKQHGADFLAPVVGSLSPAALDAAIGERSGLITDAHLGDFSEVLTWCSAKDLLAALEGSLVDRGYATPGSFRSLLRDWIIANPEAALALLPEWQRFLQVVRD
jgi:hypothetical protein